MMLPVLRRFRVIRQTPLAQGVFSIVLSPADREPMFTFQAGQWVMLHLLHEDGTEWAKAPFSIASSPSESSESFELAIKIYGDFTKRAEGLRVGDLVDIQGPYGVFTLKPGTDRLAMFAAGIGITPLRSMLREMIATNDPRSVVLFYTNKTRAGISYEQELRDLAATHPRIRIVFVLTQESPDVWDGETHRVDREMMKTYLGTFDQTDFVMCGPAEFMDSIKATLIVEGVDVKSRLRKEAF